MVLVFRTMWLFYIRLSIVSISLQCSLSQFIVALGVTMRSIVMRYIDIAPSNILGKCLKLCHN